MSRTLGERIRAARNHRGMEQADLGRALGQRDGTTVSKWENDDRRPSSDALLAIVKALRVNGHWLLTGEGAPDSPAADLGATLEEIRALVLPGGGIPVGSFAELVAFAEDVRIANRGAAPLTWLSLAVCAAKEWTARGELQLSPTERRFWEAYVATVAGEAELPAPNPEELERAVGLGFPPGTTRSGSEKTEVGT